MRLESTTKIRGYSEYLVGERHPHIGNTRLFMDFYIYDDVPEDIGKEMIAKGAEEVEPIGAGCCSPPSAFRDDVMGSVRP